MGTPLLEGDRPASSSRPSWMEALRIYTSCADTGWPCALTHSAPSSPAARPGFYLSSPELITVRFVST